MDVSAKCARQSWAELAEFFGRRPLATSWPAGRPSSPSRSRSVRVGWSIHLTLLYKCTAPSTFDQFTFIQKIHFNLKCQSQVSIQVKVNWQDNWQRWTLYSWPNHRPGVCECVCVCMSLWMKNGRGVDQFRSFIHKNGQRIFLLYLILHFPLRGQCTLKSLT